MAAEPSGGLGSLPRGVDRAELEPVGRPSPITTLGRMSCSAEAALVNRQWGLGTRGKAVLTMGWRKADPWAWWGKPQGGIFKKL